MPARRTDESGLWQHVAVASGLGIVLFGCIGGGFLLGWLLDCRMKTLPLFTLLGGGAGLAVGVYEVVRILNRVEKRDSGNDNGSTQA